MAVQKKLTIAQLTEVNEAYKKEMESKVIKMHDAGFSFILCWNFHRDSMKAWERAKKHKVEHITKVIRGLYIKEEFGREVILVALAKGQSNGVMPTYSAVEAMQELGLIPVKNKIGADLRNPSFYKFRFAEPSEVVAFL